MAWSCCAFRKTKIAVNGICTRFDLGAHNLLWNVPRVRLVLQRYSWWRHQMETFSALLAICAGNSPASGEFPTQRPVTRSFDVYFDLRPDKRLSKQSLGWWFETLSSSLWRQCNVVELPGIFDRRMIDCHPPTVWQIATTSSRNNIWSFVELSCKGLWYFIIFPNGRKQCAI